MKERSTEFGHWEFLGAIAAAGTVSAKPAPAEPALTKDRPKVDCCSCCFHKFAAGEVMEETIDIIAVPRHHHHVGDRHDDFTRGPRRVFNSAGAAEAGGGQP